MTLRVGPVGFRIGSDWRAPIAAVADLYQDYPCAEFADYTVRLEAEHVWRRWIRPSIRISGDYRLPEAAPLPLWQGLLAAELGMNLQMALGHRRHLRRSAVKAYPARRQAHPPARRLNHGKYPIAAA